jgi:hypothetical protein
MTVVRQMWKLSMVAFGLGAAVTACSSGDPLTEGRKGTTSKITDRWQPPESNATGSYEGLNGEGCSGGLKPGTKQLGEQLKAQFNTTYGGYACRANTANKSQLSIHAVGRALDITASGGAGDEIADYLVNNAEALGIQLIIWNHTIWKIGESGPSSRQYSGPNPHTDHVHAEVTNAVAANGPGAPTTGEPSGDDPSADGGAGEDPYGQDPYGDDPYGQDPYGDDPYGQDPYGDPYGDDPYGGEEAECQSALDCDPSGQVACVQGFCWW